MITKTKEEEVIKKNALKALALFKGKSHKEIKNIAFEMMFLSEAMSKYKG